MIKHATAFLLLAAVTGFALAQAPQQWTEGKQYTAIPNAQPTGQPGKVVVTEVFSFACPACNQFEPYIDKLRAELPKGAVFTYVPAGFIPTEDWPVFQRAYFTAKALGLDTPKSHDAMFKAVWGPNGALATYGADQRPKAMDAMPKIQDIAKFYAQFGGKPAEFVATANSFSVNMQVKRADQQIMAWGITGTPTIVVDGKWKLSPQTAGGAQQAVELTQYLVNRELAAKKAK